MSTTAESIITRALKRVGAIDAVETPSAEQANTALDCLNTIVDGWKTEPFSATNNEEIVVTLGSGVGSLTIGPGQAIDTPRPVRIESAYARLGTIDQSIEVVDKPEYDEVLIKGLGTSWPEILWYDGGIPTGVVRFWPVPAAPVEVHLTVLRQLQPFATIKDAQEMIPGMAAALELRLAIDLCELFMLPMPGALPARASNALRMLKRASSTVPQLNMGRRTSSRLGRFISGV